MRVLLMGSLCMLLTGTARAQVRLPALPLVQKPLVSLQQPLAGAEAGVADALTQARQLTAAALLHDNPRRLEADPMGNPAVRDEVLAYRAADALPPAVRQAGFTVLREVQQDALGVQLCVLAPPRGLSTRRALAALHTLDPEGLYVFNHLYLGGGELQEALPTTPRSQAADVPTLRGVRLGLIDTGIDRAHPAFHDARIRPWGCGGSPRGGAHGTAVASLMIGRSPPFQGVLPDAELYAADIYCGQPTGGALDALVDAFGWLVQERVAVINVSLVGPANPLLQRVVALLVAQGFVVVAAVGNDGPAAPPLYPAAYPGVVGVTGVDARLKVLIEAARGPQVMFAALGADLAAAASGGTGYTGVRGTSFAAPVVAALLATQLATPAPEDAAAVVAALAQAAEHAGRPGRDLTYGFGVVGTQYRNDPKIFLHH